MYLDLYGCIVMINVIYKYMIFNKSIADTLNNFKNAYSMEFDFFFICTIIVADKKKTLQIVFLYVFTTYVIIS